MLLHITSKTLPPLQTLILPQRDLVKAFQSLSPNAAHKITQIQFKSSFSSKETRSNCLSSWLLEIPWSIFYYYFTFFKKAEAVDFATLALQAKLLTLALWCTEIWKAELDEFRKLKGMIDRAIIIIVKFKSRCKICQKPPPVQNFCPSLPKPSFKKKKSKKMCYFVRTGPFCNMMPSIWNATRVCATSEIHLSF